MAGGAAAAVTGLAMTTGAGTAAVGSMGGGIATVRITVTGSLGIASAQSLHTGGVGADAAVCAGVAAGAGVTTTGSGSEDENVSAFGQMEQPPNASTTANWVTTHTPLRTSWRPWIECIRGVIQGAFWIRRESLKCTVCPRLFS